MVLDPHFFFMSMLYVLIQTVVCCMSLCLILFGFVLAEDVARGMRD